MNFSSLSASALALTTLFTRPDQTQGFFNTNPLSHLPLGLIKYGEVEQLRTPASNQIKFTKLRALSACNNQCSTDAPISVEQHPHSIADLACEGPWTASLLNGNEYFDEKFHIRFDGEDSHASFDISPPANSAGSYALEQPLKLVSDTLFCLRTNGLYSMHLRPYVEGNGQERPQWRRWTVESAFLQHATYAVNADMTEATVLIQSSPSQLGKAVTVDLTDGTYQTETPSIRCKPDCRVAYLNACEGNATRLLLDHEAEINENFVAATSNVNDDFELSNTIAQPIRNKAILQNTPFSIVGFDEESDHTRYYVMDQSGLSNADVLNDIGNTQQRAISSHDDVLIIANQAAHDCGGYYAVEWRVVDISNPDNPQSQTVALPIHALELPDDSSVFSNMRLSLSAVSDQRHLTVSGTVLDNGNYTSAIARVSLSPLLNDCTLSTPPPIQQHCFSPTPAPVQVTGEFTEAPTTSAPNTGVPSASPNHAAQQGPSLLSWVIIPAIAHLYHG